MTTIATSAPGTAASSSAKPRFESRSPAHLSFGGVLRSERIKLSSLRSIRITLLLTVLAGLGLSALMAFVLADQMGDGAGGDTAAMLGHQAYLLTVAGFAAPFLALIFGVLGVFAVASEYSSGMILSTLTAVPKRTPVIVAKALITAAVAAITAVIIVAGGLGLAVAFLPESIDEIASRSVVSGALGTVAYLVLFTMIAFGIATLLRSTAGGIAVVAGLAFVLPIAFQMLTMSNWEWVPTVAAYLPSELGSTLGAGLSDGGSADPATDAPGYWAAFGATAAWAAAALIPAGIAFKKRDAK